MSPRATHTHTHSFQGRQASHVPIDGESIEARIGRRIEVQANGCWVLPGKASVYANVWGRGRVEKAYRFVYETLVGEIPEGLEVHHRCRNKRCCNPEHLDVLTHADHLALHAAEPC